MGNCDFECVVIGGGPGGLVSAMYLARYRRKTALVQAGKPRAAWIPRSHNVLAFPRGISGAELLSRLSRQVNRLGVERVTGIGRVMREGKRFRISTGATELTANKVVIASGIDDIQPEIENVVELRRAGLLRYCSICDAYEHRNQPLAVLAADELGLQKALFLKSFARPLHVVVPESLRIPAVRLAELQACRARIHHGRLIDIEKRSGRRGLWIGLARQRPFSVRACYVELGFQVRDEAFAGLPGLKRAKSGLLVANAEQRTSVPGLFAVGDCVDVLAQIAVAAGQAAVATTAIHNDLLA